MRAGFLPVVDILVELLPVVELCQEKLNEEMVGKQELNSGCDHCSRMHRQCSDWLTQLKVGQQTVEEECHFCPQ